ncbi:MAG TPA: protein-disulfide reductase DsbD domain-containing protein [Parasegetibacter sp.]|jgi:hypothetical protein
MKKLLLSALVCLGFVFSSFAQINDEVKWNFYAKKIGDKTYEVHFTATIEDNWHLYSQDAGQGPIPTTFSFVKNPLLTLEGNVKEVGKMKKVFEDTFGAEVRYYEKTVDFVQVVKMKTNAKSTLAGKIEFMVCDDSRCLPPTEVEFKVVVGS